MNDCINCFRDVDDVLCKQCECVIGRIIEESSGISVKLFNVRLVEYRPMQIDVGTSQQMLMNRSIDVPNHLKRRSNSEKDEDEPLPKCHRLNDNEPFCLMRMTIPIVDISPLYSMPELNFEDTFDDADFFVDDLDLDLNSVEPLISSPFLFEIPRNWFTNLPSIVEDENDTNAIVPDFDSDVEITSYDSDVEFTPQTPPGII